MDRLRRLRRLIRAKVTKTITFLEKELAADPVNIVGLRAQYEKLHELLEELCALDHNQDDEVQSVEEYRDKIIFVNIKADAMLKLQKRPGSPTNSHFGSISGGEKKAKLKVAEN